MGDRNVLARRRDFIALLGGAAAWPRLVQAQSAMPVIGFFHPGSRETFSHLMTAFRQGLGETGFVEGRNVTIAYRWADGKNDLLPTLANELVRIPVAVIAGPSSTAAARAAQAATTAIPIVFAIGADPVKVGLVSTFNRPGGNVTGRSYMANLCHVRSPASHRALRQCGSALHHPPRATGGAGGAPCHARNLRSARVRGHRRADQLWRRPDRQMGIYTGRILKGEKPGDLPIQQSTKFDLMIHLKTARTLGLSVPPTLIARADEAIE
jgi:ABC-type uncharacterized transport system substrate-binding protein